MSRPQGERLAVEVGQKMDQPPNDCGTADDSLSRANQLDDERTIMTRYNLFCSANKQIISIFTCLTLHASVIVYFGFATNYFIAVSNKNSTTCDLNWCDGYGFLLIVMTVVYVSIAIRQVKRHCGEPIDRKLCSPVGTVLMKVFSKRLTKGFVLSIMTVSIGIYLYFETAHDRTRLKAVLGLCVLILLCLITSKHPKRVNWKPVIMGLICQTVLGFATIRWDVGRRIFDCLGAKVTTFLGYATEGARFVYGDHLVNELQVFAFTVLAVIYFFGMIIAVLYHLGAMQWTVMKLGWWLQSIVGSTVCESVAAAASIFLGLGESALLLRPYLIKLTRSEMHVVMTSGLATVSGSVLAAYIGFGADPANLITASVMAAPATLCLSKLMYPETEESQTSKKMIVFENSSYSSLLDAASDGASQATNLVLGVIANLIAFVAFVTFFNGILGYLGRLVGLADLNMQFLLGKLFIPIAWLIGIRNEDCEIVARVIGLKSVINEFVAFQALGREIEAGLHPRSAAIATFAICGFANPASIGILIGAITALCPEKREQVTALALRATIAGTLVNFMTAAIAGLLMDDSRFTGIAVDHAGNKTIVSEGEFDL